MRNLTLQLSLPGYVFVRKSVNSSESNLSFFVESGHGTELTDDFMISSRPI